MRGVGVDTAGLPEVHAPREPPTWIPTYYYRPPSDIPEIPERPQGSSMRHFGHIAPAVRKRLFYREPGEFTPDSPARLLSAALGATLYSPATRPRLADDVVKQGGLGVVSMVLCLEDSIDDAEVVDAEANLVRQFAELEARASDEVPLLFIRVRAPEQISDLVSRLG